MGTPRQLENFSIREMHDALLLAKETAMDFGSLNSRIKALDHLRVSLLPMVEWLDKPVHRCFPEPGSGNCCDLRASKNNALLLFGRFGTLCPVALARKGNWITPASAENDAIVVKISSEWLALAISRSRHDILEAIPCGHKKESVVAAELAGMKEVVDHCAFIKYLSLGMGALDERLREREGRLRVMRHNLSFLNSFVDGIDPLEYGTTSARLPTYAVFGRDSRGVGCYSGTYFVPEPVREEVYEKNKGRIPEIDDREYYVEEGGRQFDRLENLLHCVVHSIEGASENWRFGRRPLLDAEKEVIADFVEGMRSF